jgi:hypothetical protein
MAFENENENLLLSKIRDALQTVRYGYVNIVIQDGKVVQIEKTEKIRIPGQEKKGGDFTGE